MDPEESKQLKDLITAYRDCKTANEERHLIQREKAIIRNSFIVRLFDQEKQEQYRLRNVAKLIWINMLGHETDFGQVDNRNSSLNASTPSVAITSL